MSETFSTMDSSVLFGRAKAQPESGVDLVQLSPFLRAVQRTDDQPIGFHPKNESPREYSQAEIDSLEMFCRKRGIVGVAMGNMSPSQIIKMLSSGAVPQNVEEYNAPLGLPISSDKIVLHG